MHTYDALPERPIARPGVAARRLPLAVAMQLSDRLSGAPTLERGVAAGSAGLFALAVMAAALMPEIPNPLASLAAPARVASALGQGMLQYPGTFSAPDGPISGLRGVIGTRSSGPFGTGGAMRPGRLDGGADSRFGTAPAQPAPPAAGTQPAEPGPMGEAETTFDLGGVTARVHAGTPDAKQSCTGITVHTFGAGCQRTGKPQPGLHVRIGGRSVPPVELRSP